MAETKYGEFVKNPLVVTRMEESLIFSVDNTFGHGAEDRRRVP